MGGMGSGRRKQEGKDVTADMLVLDIRKIQRAGRLTPGQQFMWSWWRGEEEVASIQVGAGANLMMLNYRARSRDGGWQAMDYPVHLTWTPCNLGGRRVWFCCPAQECGRRVAILYGGSVFACRGCHKLAYASQRELRFERAVRRADDVRRRLGWQPGILNPVGSKPKGMHWRTFWRLKAEHDAYRSTSFTGIAERFDLFKH